LWNGKQWTELKQLGFPDGATIKTIDGVNAVVDAKGKILKTVGPARESALDQLKDFVGTNAPPSAATPSGWDQLKAYLHGGSNTNAAPAPTAPVNPANEVTRFSADGRAIVYDAKTKKPLRYAK